MSLNWWQQPGSGAGFAILASASRHYDDRISITCLQQFCFLADRMIGYYHHHAVCTSV